MTRVFTNRNEPLYRSERALPLGPIPAVDFAAFIRRAFESSEVWIEADAIEHILTITDGHPHDTQELAHFAWERGVEPGKVVTTSDVEAALVDVVEADDARYTTLREWLSRAQRPLVQPWQRNQLLRRAPKRSDGVTSSGAPPRCSVRCTR